MPLYCAAAPTWGGSDTGNRCTCCRRTHSGDGRDCKKTKMCVFTTIQWQHTHTQRGGRGGQGRDNKPHEKDQRNSYSAEATALYFLVSQDDGLTGTRGKKLTLVHLNLPHPTPAKSPQDKVEVWSYNIPIVLNQTYINNRQTNRTVVIIYWLIGCRRPKYTC